MSEQRQRVFSGIQPSGSTHLGNYLGALRNWERLQHNMDSVYCIVDLHALTLPKAPGEVVEGTMNMTRMLMAIGIDPALSILFTQSHVHQHAELGWLMQCVTGYGELRRMTQFKDKSDRLGGVSESDADEATSGNNASISAGLFTYPALQAADILLYDTDVVPVGDDQRQHIELTRDLANRMNSRYGEGTVVVPDHQIPAAGARVMNLQYPEQKMSKSVGSDAGTINVLDDPKAIEKKVRRAVTDNDGEVRFDVQEKPGVSNLLSILAACTGDDPEKLAEKYTQYGPLKADTAAAVIAELTPIQERYRAISDSDVAATLAVGAEKATAVAAPVMQRIRTAIGLVSPTP
ncbi:MAG: tryptophan--tRNA ligase [Acidimicrobiales bacterium]|nr:tryptophan--tRNA ligase [Acidimicrobiales bacterium]